MLFRYLHVGGVGGVQFLFLFFFKNMIEDKIFCLNLVSLQMIFIVVFQCIFVIYSEHFIYCFFFLSVCICNLFYYMYVFIVVGGAGRVTSH